jgi:hypothetical protein
MHQGFILWSIGEQLDQVAYKNRHSHSRTNTDAVLSTLRGKEGLRCAFYAPFFSYTPKYMMLNPGEGRKEDPCDFSLLL